MIHRFTCFLLVFFVLFVQGCQDIAPASTSEVETVRIISLSGFITETLCDLGYKSQIVGRDVTSIFPTEITDISNLGHISQLNMEAVLALSPDFIFVENSQIKMAPSLQALEKAGITVVTVPTSPHLNNAVQAAKTIGKHLRISDDIIKQLTQQVEADSLTLEKARAEYSSKPKVLFIYARGAGRLMVGGKNTPVAAIIEKAGGENAIQAFDDYRALTTESLIEAEPDVILMFTSGLASLDGKEGLKQIPGIAQTPAFQHDRIIAMDGHYLSAFSSRAGLAAIELAEKIHAY